MTMPQKMKPMSRPNPTCQLSGTPPGNRMPQIPCTLNAGEVPALVDSVGGDALRRSGGNPAVVVKEDTSLGGRWACGSEANGSMWPARNLVRYPQGPAGRRARSVAARLPLGLGYGCWQIDVMRVSRRSVPA